MDRLVRRLTLAAALLATPLAAICQATGEQSRGPEALIYAEALNALFAGVEARDHFSIVVSTDSISLEPAYKMSSFSAFTGERLEE
ncbi:MAG TPA: hypothetical protein VFI86_08900, partial [Burkholderiales bacterium]|nr:hypothetical protein [Burkholderiales bacterium]